MTCASHVYVSDLHWFINISDLLLRSSRAYYYGEAIIDAVNHGCIISLCCTFLKKNKNCLQMQVLMHCLARLPAVCTVYVGALIVDALNVNLVTALDGPRKCRSRKMPFGGEDGAKYGSGIRGPDASW